MLRSFYGPYLGQSSAVRGVWLAGELQDRTIPLKKDAARFAGDGVPSGILHNVHESITFSKKKKPKPVSHSRVAEVLRYTTHGFETSLFSKLLQFIIDFYQNRNKLNSE